MVIDCDRCEVRGDACQDCVITVLLGAPPSGVELDSAERRALHALADAGLVPHLQLVNRCRHETTRVGADIGVYPHDDAERAATDGERPIRHVS
ncbi:MAG: hypothetical protein ACRDRG_13570 [Pseudonocardiaceae bacterium]